MRFRFVLLGPDDDPEGHPSAGKGGRTKPDGPFPELRYEQRGEALIGVRQLPNGGSKSWVIANFRARIVRDISLDDGEDQRRELGLEVELCGRTVALSLSAKEFSQMVWVLNKLGPEAIIYPGQHQHVRVAIQCLSAHIQIERMFAHLGWRKLGAQWIYLHAAGALGPNGLVPGVQVRLPAALQAYQLRAPDPSEVVSAIRASLRFLSVAPDRISIPLLAAVYRAPLGGVDFGLFLTGKTGVFKTALAALCQQHFGEALDANHLPANFASTANALEELAFTAKDALLVVDDFVPTGGYGDGPLHGIADRLFRAAGNHQGRSRMAGNGRLRMPRPPRAFLLATGEEVPRGHSLRARLLILDLAPGDVHKATLSQCQLAAQEGHLAAAMGAFLGWMANQYEDLQQHLERRVLELRSRDRSQAIHARLPAALAQVQSGWEIFLRFALESGAIEPVERAELDRRSERALKEMVGLQASYHQASDSALRFVALLRAALACGLAHVADRLGRTPESPGSWGWWCEQNGRGWVAKGTRIGWLGGSDLFLEPVASYQAAQKVAGPEHFVVSQQTLHRRLRERGLLASTDGGREMVQVRRTLEGSPRQVLHMRSSDLAEQDTASRGTLTA
jgi:hypothetical protein